MSLPERRDKPAIYHGRFLRPSWPPSEPRPERLPWGKLFWFIAFAVAAITWALRQP